MRQRSWEPLGIRVSWGQLALGGLLFVLGLLPLIVFNARTMSTINYVRDNVFGTSYYEVDNTRIGENLRERIKALRSVLNGETFWYLSIHPYASWRYPAAFLIGGGVLVYGTLGRARRRGEELPRWVTVAATVVGGYTVIQFVSLRDAPWALAVVGVGAAAGAGVGLAQVRRGGWRALWVQLAVGLTAAAYYVVFAYLAWRMVGWEPEARTYPFAVAGLALAPWLGAQGERRRLLWPVLAIAGMLVLSVFSPTALWFTHLAIVTPWPPLLIAVAVDMVARRSGLDNVHVGRSRWLSGRAWANTVSLGTLAVVGLVGMLMYDDVEVDLAYHRDLARVGGKGDHTHASYRLVDYLEENGVQVAVAMDYGIQDVVQFLTAGGINPPEIFGYADREQPDPGFELRVQEQLGDPEAVYVFRVEPLFKLRWETFEAIATRAGREVVEESVIYDWSARPIYRLVRAVP